MKLSNTALSALLIVLCLGCSVKNKSFFPAPVKGDQNMVYESVLLDTIPLDLKICSFNGESGINAEGNIYFLDNYYCKLFIFNTSGDSLATLLGQGQGPHETPIGRISAHTFMEDGSLVLLGYALDHYWYNPDLSLRKFFFLVPNISKNITGTSKIYNHQYNNMICRSFENNVYFSMIAEHPDFNIVSQTNEYLKKCRHISEVNMSTGEDGRMLAKGYPESYYQNKPRHLILNAISFDIDQEGNFYVGYETDSLTYVYDRDFKPLTAFGCQGKQMDTDYTPIYSIEEYKKNNRKERSSKGYYYWTEYEDQTQTLFRSYHKGSGQDSDGLQIYKEGVLIGDISVPKGFRVAGYQAPYYYSRVIPNEEKETMTLYRFKL